MKFKPSVLDDKRTWLLIKSLLDKTLEELQPVLDSKSEYGYRYPEAEKLFETNVKEVVDRLKQLHAAGILEAELIDTVFTCSKCESPDLHPQQQCPQCESTRLVKLEIIEHFSCGYIGPRKDFQGEKGYLQCSECGEKLEAEKRDYKIETAVQCNDCKTFSQKPKLVLRCYNCQTISSDSEMLQHPLYVYRLNMDHRGEIIHYLGYHPQPEAEKPSRRKHRGDLDSVDHRILNLLQEDARLSFRDVARRLRISDATVRHRVTRLQKNHVIKKFTTLVDPQKVGMDVICLIHLEAKSQPASQLIQRLEDVEEVKFIMETGERQNIVLLTAFPTRQALNDFLDQYIRNHPDVQLHTVSVSLGLRKLNWKIQL